MTLDPEPAALDWSAKTQPAPWALIVVDDPHVIAGSIVDAELMVDDRNVPLVFGLTVEDDDGNETRFDINAQRLHEQLVSVGLDYPQVGDHVKCLFSDAAETVVDYLEYTPADGSSPTAPQSEPPTRRLKLVKASTYRNERPRWLFDRRIPLGELTLIAGKEGTGKSFFCFDLAADVSRGHANGELKGKPRSVIVVAPEDNWAFTIAPRLRAAGADMERVFNVEVEIATYDDEPSLTFPYDGPAIAELVKAHDVALVLLDPIISRLNSQLDTHKDSDVRRGLEPLAAIAHEGSCAVVGIIHVNKSQGTDALDRVMGSKAFTAVARSVLFVVPDPERPRHQLLALRKSNLTSVPDVPALRFKIEDVVVEERWDGDVHAGKLVWEGESTMTVEDALAGPSWLADLAA